jgi:hypothetical protein
MKHIAADNFVSTNETSEWEPSPPTPLSTAQRIAGVAREIRDFSEFLTALIVVSNCSPGRAWALTQANRRRK